MWNLSTKFFKALLVTKYKVVRKCRKISTLGIENRISIADVFERYHFSRNTQCSVENHLPHGLDTLFIFFHNVDIAVRNA